MSKSKRDNTPDKRKFSANKKSTYKSYRENSSSRKDEKSFSSEKSRFKKPETLKSNDQLERREKKSSSENSYSSKRISDKNSSKKSYREKSFTDKRRDGKSFDSGVKRFKKSDSLRSDKPGDRREKKFSSDEKSSSPKKSFGKTSDFRSSSRSKGADEKRFKNDRPFKSDENKKGKSSFSGESNFSDKRKTGEKKSWKKEEPESRRGRKTPFTPFSKSKPSESSRRSAFKKLDKDFSKFPEPPAYNLKAPKGAKKSGQRKSDGEKIRLNKFISNSGVCSRRDADLLIQAGEITVNGTIITELGYKVERGDIVKYQGQALKSEKPVYVLLNKPKDFITTTDDPEERKTVMSLVKTACKERIYPVGRLDRQTTGLLLLTNDGELAKKLTHPSHNIKKIYQVDLDKPITNDDFEKIVSGFELEDGPVHVDSLALVSSDKKSLGIEIHEGRNRIVRRIFESLGYEVVKLDRVVYAGLTKKDLPRGNWRYLSEKEVIQLKYFL